MAADGGQGLGAAPPPGDGFHVVFDAGDGGVWLPAAAGLLVTVVLCGLVLRPDLTLAPAGAFRPGERAQRALFKAALVVAATWTAMATLSASRQSEARRAAPREGRDPIADGIVTDLQHSRHGPERFTVAGRRFAYYESALDGAFNRMAPQGGPLREGAHVRVTYHDDTILRLEVAE